MFKKLLSFWRSTPEQILGDSPALENASPTLLETSIDSPEEKIVDPPGEINYLSKHDIQRYIQLEVDSRTGRAGEEEVANLKDFDQKLGEACRLIVTHQQGSTSLIQRKMKLGYERAGRIMDEMEIIGVVGSFTGSKARDVLFHDLGSLEDHLRSMGIHGLPDKKYLFFQQTEMSKYEAEINQKVDSFFNDLREKREQEEREAIRESILAKERLQKERKRKTDLQRQIEQELADQGLISAIEKYGRETIPEEVRNSVWNRDAGKCVACGVSERLEFDHIIPLSRGGANTYRNLQLLCEPCNRKKSNKIG